MADAGFVAIATLISPHTEGRASVRERHRQHGTRFAEVYVDAPLVVCEERDPKGLYRLARAGEISNFTGIDDPYEPPASPELHLDTSVLSVDQSARAIAAIALDGS